ncbi:ubiquinone/menaquinone biosynthesis methyltransferase [Lyticum sinuosum]|uniref:Ubiquinone/menaquinone biosynthesis C-methyltransferase UbiE n=1 Tax=Lyticum sinuosum TaxID=1332059 RepID=A0AAE5AHR6_9RICK|nr:ubiquinone/menaquinone biosynthesis methyltransferase [Lyticum sinuosum]MDZ5761059.1 Ubiquinone/menaquinone biosynthesis C-methyltransferase UbiE [Lyticum sinuosum]
MKKFFVQNIFSEVANKYDLMNDLMSFGFHRYWKKKAANCIRLHHKDNKIIDLAGGTGDVARILVNRGATDVTVADINQDMINVGKDKDLKSHNSKYIKYIKWIQQDAEEMDNFVDGEFTHCTMFFGIRNMTNISLVLKNIHRILDEDGQFVCLEFCPPKSTILGGIYKSYLNNFIPFLGKFVAHNYKAYKYLSDSINTFPETNKFIDILQNSGFNKIMVEKTIPHVANIFSCYK